MIGYTLINKRKADSDRIISEKHHVEISSPIRCYQTRRLSVPNEQSAEITEYALCDGAFFSNNMSATSKTEPGLGLESFELVGLEDLHVPINDRG